MRALALAGLLAVACTAALPAAGAARVLNPDLAGVLPLADGALLAWGSDAAVWHRPTAGAAWQPGATGQSARIRALAATPQRLVAVGDRGLLLQAGRDGRAWRADGAAGAVPLVALDCREDRCMAVGGDDLVLRSAPGGAGWQRVAGPQGALTAVRAGAGAHWWVGSADGRLWHSADDGEHWRALRAGPAAIDALAAQGEAVWVASADGRLLAAQAGRAALLQHHRSRRGSYTRLQPLPGPGAWAALGAHGACAWRPAAHAAWRDCSVARQRLLRGLASSPDGRRWVLVGEAGLLLRSDDRGRRWQALSAEGLDDGRDLEDVAWDPSSGGFVAVGAGGLVLAGDAQGRRWRVEHQAPRHYVHAVVQTREGGLLAGLSHRTLARSEDGGLHWAARRFDGLQEPAYLFALHADPVRGSLVAAGGQGSVMVAPDGRRWHHASAGHGSDYLGLVVHPERPLVLLHGTGGRVLRVDTQAAAWQGTALPAPDPVYGSLHSADGVLLLGAGGLVLSSDDFGLTWQAQRVGTDTLHVGSVTPDGSAELVAGDRGALYRRTRDAQRRPGPWQRVAVPTADWRVLQPDAAGRALWLAGSGGRFARSTDGGLTWTEAPMPTRSALRRPVHDPARGRWWMPGRDGTLLRSDDDGLSWQPVHTGTEEHLKGVWVDPRSGDVLAYGARLVHVAAPERP